MTTCCFSVHLSSGRAIYKHCLNSEHEPETSKRDPSMFGSIALTMLANPHLHPPAGAADTWRRIFHPRALCLASPALCGRGQDPGARIVRVDLPARYRTRMVRSQDFSHPLAATAALQTAFGRGGPWPPPPWLASAKEPPTLASFPGARKRPRTRLLTPLSLPQLTPMGDDSMWMPRGRALRRCSMSLPGVPETRSANRRGPFACRRLRARNAKRAPARGALGGQAADAHYSTEHWSLVGARTIATVCGQLNTLR